MELRERQAGRQPRFLRSRRTDLQGAAIPSRVKNVKVGDRVLARQTPNDLVPKQSDYAEKAWLAQQI
jgi:hypothetical protein